jgi:hypothetical protein
MAIELNWRPRKNIARQLLPLDSPTPPSACHNVRTATDWKPAQDPSGSIVPNIFEREPKIPLSNSDTTALDVCTTSHPADHQTRNGNDHRQSFPNVFLGETYTREKNGEKNRRGLAKASEIWMILHLSLTHRRKPTAKREKKFLNGLDRKRDSRQNT